jgi:hypothetical protein
VEVEAIELGLARTASSDMPEVGLVAEAADAGAGARTEGDAALDGGADKTGEDRRGVGEGVGGRAVVVRLELVAGEQPSDPAADGNEDLGDIFIAHWRGGVKCEPTWRALAEDAVQHESMEMDVELEAAAEALDDCQRARLAALDAVGARRARIERDEGAGKHAQHGAAQGMIPGQTVAQAIGERQDPLTYRHVREHLLDECSGVFGHAAPATARAEATALAREGQKAFEGAVGAPKPRETVGEHAAGEEVSELLLDEAGQAVSVTALPGFSEEGLEVLANDGMQGRVLGVAGLIRPVTMGHALA